MSPFWSASDGGGQFGFRWVRPFVLPLEVAVIRAILPSLGDSFRRVLPLKWMLVLTVIGQLTLEHMGLVVGIMNGRMAAATVSARFA